MAKRIAWTTLGWFLGLAILFAVIASLDRSFPYRLLIHSWDRGFGEGLNMLGVLSGVTVSYLVVSLLPFTVLYVIVALVDAKWGPPRQPWFTLPPGSPHPRRVRLMSRTFNLFPPGRVATFTFWLLVLLVGLGFAAAELHSRFASGNWPRPPVGHVGDGESTGNLAPATFYALVSMRRLVWRAAAASSSQA